MLALATLLIDAFLPGPRRRRFVAGALSRAFLFAARVPFTVEGSERLPRVPCVVVANHASYIDAVVAIAALPPDFAFVIKKEMMRVPVVGFFLKRLGSQFVERFNRQASASDARRVQRVASAGQSLVFFPEGTFDEVRAIRKFWGGAFATAARGGMPVVAVAIHGTRELFPPGGVTLYRTPVRVEILAVLQGPDARSSSRELIARAVGEPLAPE